MDVHHGAGVRHDWAEPGQSVARPEEQHQLDEQSDEAQVHADEPRLTREDKIIYWSVAIALLILTPLVLYIAFRARTGL
jgi:hypothetical protein